MTKPNAKVQAELDRLDREFDEGCTEGYDAPVTVMPPFFTKPYANMTARERGWIFGRQLRLNELQEKGDA